MQVENTNIYKDWIPVAAAFAGGFLAVLGGLIAGFFNRSNLKLQLSHQSKLEIKKLRLIKIEELSLLANQVLIDLIYIHQKILTISMSELKPEELVACQERFYGTLSRLNSTLTLYVPELMSDASEIIEAGGQYFNYGLSCIANKRAIDIEQHNKHQKALSKLVGELMNKISGRMSKSLED